MKRYLIDTNHWILMLHRGHKRIRERIDNIPVEQCWISSVAIAELYYGAERSQRAEENRHTVDLLIDGGVNILPFDVNHTFSFGSLRHILEKMGTPIGSYDLMMAAQATAEDMIIVTNNRREFERIPSLLIEDWTE